MNWKMKNAMFFILETIPFGERVYYLFQKYITGSVWVDDAHFKSYFETKVKIHLETIEEFGKSKIHDSTFFEFGAGWDMLAAIGLARGGTYIAVDLNNYAHPELVRNTIDLYKRNASFLSLFYDRNELDEDGTKFVQLSFHSSKKLKEDLKRVFNIDYYAPMDAGNTPFHTHSVDYVISNVSLEHIPYKDIDRIFHECHRLLKDDGLLSVTVDYTDHWQHTDPSISVFNYMQYSEKEWKKYNPSMHYQNRLQHSDYVKLLEKNGFAVIKTSVSVRDEERKILEAMAVSDRFDNYSIDELLLRSEHFVAIKKYCRI